MNNALQSVPSIPADTLASVLSTLERIALALEQRHPDAFAGQGDELPAAIAYRWQSVPGMQTVRRLQPVNDPQLLRFADLRNVDAQRQAIERNTAQFVHGYPANNVLMTGARGTGKSSLVRACLQAFADQGLRLIEVEKQHLDDLPQIVDEIRQRPERFIIFCDDLSFEEGETSYKGLKTVLDGSVAGPSANVLVYATSNRRHLVSERASDNLEHHTSDNGELHPGDSVEEKISLSERFGLSLHFYSFSQDEYLTAVAHWLQHFGFTGDDISATRTQALQWALQRGARSGRIAWQFARDYTGRKRLVGM